MRHAQAPSRVLIADIRSHSHSGDQQPSDESARLNCRLSPISQREIALPPPSQIQRLSAMSRIADGRARRARRRRSRGQCRCFWTPKRWSGLHDRSISRSGRCGQVSALSTLFGLCPQTAQPLVDLGRRQEDRLIRPPDLQGGDKELDLADLGGV